MRSIKAVIFDLDGTLADTIPLCVTCFRQALEPIVHRSLTDEEILAAFGPDEEGTIKKFTSDSKKATEDFMRLYQSHHDMYTAPFEGIAPLLDSLKRKGVHLALATGKGTFTCHFSLEKLGLLSYFDVIETGSPEGSRKIEAIQQILHSFPDIDKQETIYVGDSASDIKESHQAGINAVAAAWAETAKEDELKKEMPDHFFTTVADFAGWLSAHV